MDQIQTLIMIKERFVSFWGVIDYMQELGLGTKTCMVPDPVLKIDIN